MILKPNFKTKSLNFLDFAYLTQQKKKSPYVLRSKILRPQARNLLKLEQIRRSSDERLKIYASAPITGNPQPKNVKTVEQKMQKTLPFLLCKSQRDILDKT